MSAVSQSQAYAKLGNVMKVYDKRFSDSLKTLVDTSDDPIASLMVKGHRLKNHLAVYAPNGGETVLNADIVTQFASAVEKELKRRMDMIQALKRENGDLSAVVESQRAELKELKHPNAPALPSDEPLTTRQNQQHVVVSTEIEWGTIAEYCQKWGVVGANKRGTGYHKVMAATRRKTRPLKSRQEPGRPWEVDMGTYFKLNRGQ